MKKINRDTPSAFRELYSVGIDFTVVRSLYLFTICLLLISISSCHEEQPVCGDDFVTGQMTMNINSSEWEGGAYTLETSILAVAGVYYYGNDILGCTKINPYIYCTKAVNNGTKAIYNL